MKDMRIGPFKGINNRLPEQGLMTEDGAWLHDAVNCDIDNAGAVLRRTGFTLLHGAANPHSLFKLGDDLLLVRGAVLYRVTPAPYAETAIKTLVSDAPMSYVEANGSVYFSNGTDAGRYDGTAVYPWAMSSPAQPVVYAVAGALPSGQYRVALTFFNAATGEESGHAGATVLHGSGGIGVTLPLTGEGATHVRVYAGVADGDQLFFQQAYPLGTFEAALTVVHANTARLARLPEAPMPPCLDLFVHMGRLCGRSGNMLYYGEPYRFGYYRPSKGFIPFMSAVTLAVPNQNGVYVATENLTQWIPGDLEKPDAPLADVLPYGAVAGTAFALTTKKQVGWFSPKGFVIADAQGQAEAPMVEEVDLTPPISGATHVTDAGGQRRVFSCGWSLSLDGGGSTRYTGFDFTSFAGDYATGAGGLYALGGNTDAGMPIVAQIDLGKLEFGADSKKAVPAVYLGCSSEDKLCVTLGEDAGNSYDYLARSFSYPEVEMHRVDPGKGLRSRWYKAVVSNPDGGDFYLATVAFAPAIFGRKV